MGKNEASEGPLGEQVVVKLTECLENKDKHILYMDRFFNSTNSFRKLKNEHNLRCTGTVMENRIEKCPVHSKRKCRRKKEENIFSFQMEMLLFASGMITAL